jgi:hypothetical protein
LCAKCTLSCRIVRPWYYLRLGWEAGDEALLVAHKKEFPKPIAKSTPWVGGEDSAQVAAELVAAVEQKPPFPTEAVEQTAAIFAALAAASQPLDAEGLAAQFKRTKTTEKKVGDELLVTPARLGYVT